MQISGSYSNLYSLYKVQNYYFQAAARTQSLSSPQPSYFSSGYQDSFRTKFTNALKETRDLAVSLDNSSKALTTFSRGDAFEKRALTSSDSTLVKGTALDNATEAQYSITVSQLATAQKNSGNNLTSNGANNVTAGTNSFEITNNGKNYNLSVEVAAGDTNKMVLEKMAQAINKSDAGLTAKVVSDSATNSSRIEITGKATGVGNEFTIQDNTGSNLIAQTGATSVTTQTQDAVYRLNNVDKTSKSNKIEIDNGKVALELTVATSSQVNIKVGKDEKQIANAVTNFVSDYNKMINSLQENKGIINSSILRDLTRYTAENRLSLQNIGIQVNEDKTLKVDGDKLVAAVRGDSSSVQRIIGSSGGLAYKTHSRVSSLVNSPLSTFASSNLDDADQKKLYYQQQLQLQRYTQYNNYLTAYSAGSFFNSLI